MAEAAVTDDVVRAIEQAEQLAADGAVRDAIDLLTHANRAAQHAELERALVGLRRQGAADVAVQPPAAPRPALVASPSGGDIVELAPGELTSSALRHGFAQSGCALVRGLVSAERAATLAAGIDAALAAYDAATSGSGAVDPGWYDPGPMPDRVSPGLPEDVHRSFLRSRGSLWTVDSPRMTFDLFEMIEQTGLGSLMTDFLGERPLMSAIKGTLRRMPPEVDIDGRWHQDGAFLGEQVGAFNCWLALTPCGTDAPGLDVVPKRLDGIVPNDGARYDWAVADDAVLQAASGTPIVRPLFDAGDALIFDHLLLHRTGASREMTKPRYAIESWFFAPSAYPTGQLPVLY